MSGSRVITLILLILGTSACSEFRKIQKSGDWQLKYNAAIAYYENQDYHRATLLLENILPIIRGSEKAELGNFYLAYCYFHQKQYIISAHHFQEFVRIYGRSEYAMEAEYMHGYSLYLQSPNYQLDQTVTYEALATLQNFINRYPTSEYASKTNTLIDEMQVKLEKKAYEKCRLYHRIRKYKAAIVVYDHFKNDFPDSNYQEEVAFLRIKTSYNYAKESTYKRQEERYKYTIQSYETFIDKYPNSEYLKEVEKLYASSIKEITNFANSK